MIPTSRLRCGKSASIVHRLAQELHAADEPSADRDLFVVCECRVGDPGVPIRVVPWILRLGEDLFDWAIDDDASLHPMHVLSPSRQYVTVSMIPV